MAILTGSLYRVVDRPGPPSPQATRTGYARPLAPRQPSIPTPPGLDARAWADAVAEVERDCGCEPIIVAGRGAYIPGVGWAEPPTGGTGARRPTR